MGAEQYYEYVVEKTVVYKMKGNFRNDREAIEKARTCFDGKPENIIDSIGHHSGVTEIISAKDWEVTDRRTLVSKDSFIASIISLGGEEQMPNHYILVDKDVSYYYYITKDCAYYWTNKDSKAKLQNFCNNI